MTETAIKEKACCFTGHRTIPYDMTEYLTKRVTDGLDYLYSQGINTFLAGGAIGFDTLAAKAVIHFRKAHRDVRLVLIIPCQDQTKKWKLADIITYKHIKKQADEVICLSDHYYNGCMHDRNRYLVDHSSACICYLTQPDGGTAFTVKYAKSKGLSVFNLAQSKR